MVSNSVIWIRVDSVLIPSMSVKVTATIYPSDKSFQSIKIIDLKCSQIVTCKLVGLKNIFLTL